MPRQHYYFAALIGLLALVCGIAIASGSYTRTETVRGILVTDLPSTQVVAVRPGILTELSVHEGQEVRAGQKLGTVVVEQSAGNGGFPLSTSLAALDEERRNALFRAKLAHQLGEAEQARLTAQIAGLDEQIDDLRAQYQTADRLSASLGESFNQITAAFQKGYVSRPEYDRRLQNWLSARQQLQQLQAQRHSLMSQRRQAQAELERGRVSELNDISSQQSTAAQALEQRAEVETQRSYTLAAPINGIVTSVQGVPGSTVEPSVPVLAIVPSNSGFHAELYAPTRAVGFVHEGQEVRLLYDAYPFEKYGSFGGRIRSVSRAVMSPKEVAAPLKIEEPVYRIEVAPDASFVIAYGERRQLQSGMTLSATLILDRHSFADWLLEPLRAVLKRDK